MGVYVKGMEMPKDKPLIIKINPDGAVSSTFDNDYRKYEAVSISPHGRLIDADKLRKAEFIHDGDAYAVVMSRDIEQAPIIIPAEEGE